MYKYFVNYAIDGLMSELTDDKPFVIFSYLQNYFPDNYIF